MSQSVRNIFRNSRKNFVPYYSQNIRLKIIHFKYCLNLSSVFSLNVFIANTKQGVRPQVFPTLVTALPLQYTYKALHRRWRTYLSRDMRFPTMRYVRQAKAQTSLRIRAV